MTRRQLARHCLTAGSLGVWATGLKADEPNRDDKEPATTFDTVILGGRVVDGTGNPWFLGDVGIAGDRIARVAPAGQLRNAQARRRIEADGLVVAPGFIDILSHSREALLEGDSRLVGKITQGVTSEILGEGESNAPARRPKAFDGPGGFDRWLRAIQERGAGTNFGSFVGSGTVRFYVKGMDPGPPTASQLDTMKALVRDAMECGAFGLASALIYPPDSFVATDDLIALSQEMASYGGVYITHIRSEADRLLEAIDEAIRIGREGGVPVEIYHLKAAGKRNWPKAAESVARIEKARAEGLDLRANMYPYDAAGTGLTACLPPSAAEGGKLYERLADPQRRAEIRAEILNPTTDWENLAELAGPENVLVLGLRKPENRRYAGRRLAEIAAERGVDWVDAALELLASEQQRISTIYFLMSEENVRMLLQKPWMGFGTDSGGHDPRRADATGLVHPRSYGTFPRILGRYVRDEGLIRLEDAIRRMTSLPASRLSLQDRGLIRERLVADVVVFDPNQIIDRATYERPHQLSVGVRDVFVNGVAVVSQGEPTGAKPGRILRGPGYRRGTRGDDPGTRRPA